MQLIPEPGRRDEGTQTVIENFEVDPKHQGVGASVWMSGLRRMHGFVQSARVVSDGQLTGR